MLNIKTGVFKLSSLFDWKIQLRINKCFNILFYLKEVFAKNKRGYSYGEK